MVDTVAAPRARGGRLRRTAQFGPLGDAGRRIPILLASRVVEQVVLGGAALLLAARLGLDAFAPVSALLVVNSAAVTLSDYGVGLAVLRCPPDRRVATRSLWAMRWVNAVLAMAGIVAGLSVGSTAGTLVVASAVIWAVSAEAFVRKAAALASGHGRRCAVAELLGSLAFAVPVLVLATGDHALAVVGAALLLKHGVEVLVAGTVRDRFGRDGVAPQLRALCSSQVLAYALGNVDYVIVAIVLGATAFSIYSLAYRVAVAVPSVVAYVATRTAVSDFSTAADTDEQQARYSKYLRPLFVIGVVSAVAAIGIGVALPGLLGSSWDAIAPTIAVLALAAPWRMIAGQAGALAIAGGSERHLVRWELTRLALFTVAFTAAAAAGFTVFVAVVTCAWILGVTWLHELATRRHGLRPWRALVPLAAAACILAVTVAALTGVTP